jgi:hypothetical protein
MRRGLRRFTTGFGECLPANSPLLSFRVRFEMKYRAEATTLEGFIQQLAAGYVCRGYWFYYQGFVPAGKDPRAVDAKLIARYGVTASKFERARRKARGLANVQYLRYGRHFVLISTPGERNPLRNDHKLQDAHEVPIKLGGYAVSFRGGHACVRIERNAWKQLKAYYLGLATKRSVSWFEREFRRWPFEPWAPIRRQTFVILNQVNRARKAAGLELVPTSCVRIKRRIYRPFEEPVAAESVGGCLAEKPVALDQVWDL